MISYHKNKRIIHIKMKQNLEKVIDQNIPEQIKSAIQILNQNHFEAYLVGGSIRDFLLQKKPKDFDIASNAKPDQVLNVFKNFTVIPTGVRYGTVTVIMPGQKMEITTYRIESDYQDYRRPSQITFTESIHEDLARRDFTINALAYHPEKGLLDFFGSQKDLKSKIIRAVGEADQRFQEDPLRILRALRFASRLGFSIEGKTAKAMYANKILLNRISKERIRQEFTSIITANYAKEILLKYKDIFAVFIPDIINTFDFDQHNAYHIYDVYRHSIEVLDNVPNELDLRLAAFYHDIAKPLTFSKDQSENGHFYGHARFSAEIAKKSLLELKFDSKMIDQVYLLVKYHDIPILPEKNLIKKRLSKFGKENFFKILLLQKADTLGKAKEIIPERLIIINQIENLANEIINEKTPLHIKDLKVNGYDAMQFGLKASQIGKALQLLLDAILNDELKNERQSSLNYLEEIAAQILKDN